MINRVHAYTVLNVKSLFKDKISFVWSVVLPLLMFFVNQNHIQHENDVTYWWVYMILCSYIYGIGVYALELKEAGCLRTIFSIHNSSVTFFLGNLITQIIFSFISIFVFDIAVAVIKDFSVLKLALYSMKCIVLCIPFAFGGYGLTLLRKWHVQSIRTIFTILIFGMFMFIGFDSEINLYNPLYFISDFVMDSSGKNILFYMIFSVVLVFIGVIGILHFDPNSNERR